MSHDVTESLGSLFSHSEGEAAASSKDEIRGLSLGRYLLLESLGQGGMGVVFSAYDPELDRKIAVKVLRAELLQSEVARARLVREAKAIAQLNHPNLVRVYDASAVGDQFFLAMELIEGRTLAQWLAEESRSWREVVQLFLDFGAGLYAVHRAGLVHRDVKPSNVMVTQDGRGVLVDFGLARLVDRAAEDSSSEASSGTGSPLAEPLTCHRGAVGTPAYMSPEQRRGEPTDQRSDQFSFCACLYEALHQRPYRDFPQAPEGVGEADGQRGSVPAGRQLAPTTAPRVPRWIHRILERGLAEDPENRFASLAELLTALRRDPARRWRRLALVAGSVAVLALVAWGSYRSATPIQLCQGAQRKLAGVWDSQVREQLRQDLLATGASFAEDSWAQVERSLGAYTDRWVDLHVGACEATHQRGEQSEAMLDLQVACLEDRLHDVRAAVEVLGGLEAQSLSYAPAVLRLPSLEGCRDLGALMALEEPPADPSISARVEQVRGELAQIRARIQAGQLEGALQGSDELIEEVDGLGYGPVAAEAYLYLARGRAYSGKMAEASEMLTQAVELALRSQHDEVLARSLISLVIVARISGDAQAVDRWAGLARAAVERRARPDLRADFEFALGMVANMEGESQRAVEHFQAFLEHPRDTLSSEHQAHHNIALAYLAAGDLEPAAVSVERSLALQREGGAPWHRDVVASLSLLGQIRQQQGRFEESLAAFSESLDLSQQVGLRDFRVPVHRSRLGRLLIELDRPEEAIVALELALAEMEDLQNDPLDVARAQFYLARALQAAGRQPTRRHELAREAREVLVGLGARAVEDVEEIQEWLVSEQRS
jgi:tetratricopeptide (TPR) repeat protein/predicted Ser/Thr protein kinase